jgi:phage tail-like protein
MPVRRDDPYANFNFVVEIDGIEPVGFSEVELPEARVAEIPYREGADVASAARVLPGRVAYGPLTLRRGVTGDTSLFEWWRAIRDGTLDQRAANVYLRDEGRNVVQTWRFRRTWPTTLAFSPLRGLGNEIAIETLVLSHDGFEIE